MDIYTTRNNKDTEYLLKDKEVDNYINIVDISYNKISNKIEFNEFIESNIDYISDMYNKLILSSNYINILINTQRRKISDDAIINLHKDVYIKASIIDDVRYKSENIRKYLIESNDYEYYSYIKYMSLKEINENEEEIISWESSLGK